MRVSRNCVGPGLSGTAGGDLPRSAPSGEASVGRCPVGLSLRGL